MSSRTRVIAIRWVLAVSWLAVGCAESVGPGRGRAGLGPGAVSFNVAAGGGIVLDQWNGDFDNQPDASGTILRKGFNPRNPRLGDAIVATFFWLSSSTSNTIDTVTDVITNVSFSPVGNTYHLVEFVHAGGMSMATYVATNVQNFPDTSTDPNEILAVEARLSETTTRAGMVVTAWTGVAGDFAQALGPEHVSASGSGSPSSPTSNAGPIAVSAGALAYAVTTASPPAGVDPPPGFGHIGGYMSNASMTGVADSAVQGSAGMVHPEWFWGFSGPSTWLASVLSLNPGTATPPANQPPAADFTFSCTTLTCAFTSTSSDPDGAIAGHVWAFGDGTSSDAANPSKTYAAAGSYTVTLQVTDDQGAQDQVSKTVTVTAPNQAPVVNAGPDETAWTGLLYSLSASFSDPDNGPWSYRIDWGDGETTTGTTSSPGTITAGHTYLTILPRSFTIRVTVTDSRGASGSDTKVVTVLLL